ncbi:tRNA (adenosine(37)-N6)-dimethylallyltransferase [Lacunimicrobium album]
MAFAILRYSALLIYCKQRRWATLNMPNSGRSEFSLPVELLQQCCFLSGPTASGKTAVSLHLARLIDAEIILLDSMTIYRQMGIGTAKPTKEEQGIVPHHGIDLAEPWQEFSLHEYLNFAKTACEDIVSRGKRPLFVGGTGLYLRSLLRGICESPAADWEFRQSMEKLAEQRGEQWLHDELKKVDAVSAARLHPNDQRRIIRALEVHRMTGEPLSSQHLQSPLPVDVRPKHVYWLDPEREWLYQRIDQRVIAMFEEGFWEETVSLLELPLPISRTARQALGYKEIIEAIETGKTDRASVIQEIQTRTRQFAKRQLTWFRNLEEATSIPIQPGDRGEVVAQRIAERVLGDGV